MAARQQDGAAKKDDLFHCLTLYVIVIFLPFVYGLHFALYLPVGGGQELHGLHLLLQVLEQDEEHRHEEQDGEDAEQHAAYHART